MGAASRRPITVTEPPEAYHIDGQRTGLVTSPPGRPIRRDAACAHSVQVAFHPPGHLEGHLQDDPAGLATEDREGTGDQRSLGAEAAGADDLAVVLRRELAIAEPPFDVVLAVEAETPQRVAEDGHLLLARDIHVRPLHDRQVSDSMPEMALG